MKATFFSFRVEYIANIYDNGVIQKKKILSIIINNKTLNNYGKFIFGNTVSD
jgi:hypothetical protein